MFESLIQPPAGVLPVQHEFVTIATDHFFASEIAQHEMTAVLDSSLPVAVMHMAPEDTQQTIGALDNAPPTPPRLDLEAANTQQSFGALDNASPTPPKFAFGVTDDQPPPGRLAGAMTTPTALPTLNLGATDSLPPPPPR